MKSMKRILKGTSYVILTNLFLAFIGYFTKILIAREFSVEDFGLIFGVISFFEFFHLIYYLGIDNAVIKFVSDFKAKKNTFKELQSYFSGIVTQFKITFPLSLVILSLSPLIANYFFKTNKATSLLIIGSLALILHPLRLIKSYFAGIQKIDKMSLINALEKIILFVFTLLFILVLPKKNSINAYMLSYFIFFVALIIINLIILKKNKLVNLYNKKLSKKMLLYGLPLVFSSALGMLFGKIDVLMLTYFRNLTEVAWYNVSVPTVKSIYGLIGSFSLVYFPLANEMLKRDNKKSFKKNFNRLLKYILIICIPSCLFIILNSKEIINLLFGVKYIDAHSSLIIYAFMILLVPLNKIFYPILLSLSKTKEVAKNSIIAMIVDMIGNFLLIFKWGILGVAFSSLLGYLTLIILNFKVIKKNLRLKFPLLKSITLIILSGICIGLTNYILGWLNSSSILFVFVLKFILYFGMFGVIILITKQITIKEIVQLIKS